MDEPQCPVELSEDAWQITPPEVRQFIALLMTKLVALEARLNQNSQNSSDPPSAPPRPAKTPCGKPKTKGAQPGHPYQQRDLIPTSAVIAVVPMRPTSCPACQHTLPDELDPVGPPRRQQVWEIPLAPPEVTEYRYHTLVCPCRQAWVPAERPDDVPPGAFGPRLVALIALLRGRYRISNRELVDLAQLVWQIPISVDSVCQFQQVASLALTPALAETQSAIAAADHVHVDETRWREGSRTPWLWVAVGTLATLFMIQPGRGKTQMQTLLDATFTGRVTSDRSAAYNSLPPERRQVCWAHLIRNLRSWVEANEWWQVDAAELLALADLVFAVWERCRAGAIDRATLRAMLQPIQQAMWTRTQVVQHDGHCLSSMCAELIRLWDALWTFVEVEGVEPTNSAAERALRPAVLWRKGSYGTQSDGGSRFVERTLTMSATCQQHECPLFPYLIAAITAYWANQLTPKAPFRGSLNGYVGIRCRPPFLQKNQRQASDPKKCRNCSNTNEPVRSMHRILYVNATAVHGGAEESLFVAIDAIRNRAIEPVLVVPAQGWLTRRCSEVGIPYEVLPGLPDAFATDTFSLQARAWIPNALAIARLARGYKAVLIHANSPRTSYHAGLGARLARLPSIVHVHDADPEYLPYSKPLKRLLLTPLSDHFIAVSAATAEMLRTLLPAFRSRISVVYNGRSMQFYEHAQQTDIRAELGLSSNTLLVGSISAMTPWKGQDVLIRAFPAVHARFPQARLLIVGGGQGAVEQERFAAYLRTLVTELRLNDVVHFTGWRDDVVSIMRALDLFVHVPTRPDPLPTVVIHACALGCLIVAARIGGIPEIVEDGMSGMLVPPRDPTALSVAIIHALTNRENLVLMRRNARQHFLRRFSVGQMIDGLLEVYGHWVPGLNHT